MSEWETFCDISYYDLWRVRRKGERRFNDGFDLQHREEAMALVELLNKLERERRKAIVALREAIQFRDKTLNGYNLEEWIEAAGLKEEAK
jgi:hypothetical protein